MIRSTKRKILTKAKLTVGTFFLWALFPFFGAGSVFAQAQIRVATGYEDSVRILILYNIPTGSCGWMPAVGVQTKDFTVKSISGGHIGDPTLNPNVKILPTATTTWANVVGLWPGKLPHVIVHVNAGWETYNGPNDGAALMTIYDSATTKYIGIVEIGDDAAYLGIKVFGFTNTVNVPPPINDGTQYTNPTDTMFLGFYPNRDTLVDSTTFPYLKGIIHNALGVLGKPRADFKRYVVNGTNANPDTLRCQADADQYNVAPAFQNRLTFLGYQNVSRNGALVVVPPTNPELDVVVAFQDTIHVSTGIAIRRAVALSIEPQFLKNTQAMYQLTYDAIMFASLAWQNRPAASIQMTVQPPSGIIPAGDSVVITAVVLDDAGIPHPEYGDSIKWTFIPTGTASSMRTTFGSTNTFYGIDAYITYQVIASFVDPYHPSNRILDTVPIYVKPGPATHLNIEASADSTVSLRDDNPMRTDVISSTTQKDSVYAVLRDRYGNWVSHATLAAWLSRDTTVITAAPGNTSLGEGIMTRKTAKLDTTFLIATQGSFMDSLRVIISNVTYSQIQIYVLSGGVKPIDTLKMRTDQDTSLHARGLRADGSGQWDDLNVSWHAASQLTFNNTPPSAGALWSFMPLDTGSGPIYISFTSAAELRDTIRAVFIPGNAFREALYPLPGPPNTATNALLPAAVTVAAGTPFQITAKIFDSRNLWLSSYERTNAPIAWTVTEVTGSGATGTLSASTGYLTVFTPRRAFNIVRITASFQEGAVSIPPQSIIITVVPGPIDHLVIEGDTSRLTSPNSDNPKGTVVMGARDTAASVYAILRDFYGNWAGWSRLTDWISLDTNQVKAAAGNTFIGEGVVTRVSKNGQTYVIARDLDSAQRNGRILTDSVMVVLTSISYDSLRIVVRDSFPIQTLNMRTDQDTLLQVQGKRSDNGRWEPVSADWLMLPALRTSSAAPKSANYWRFTPIDTGSGRIMVVMGSSAPDTMTFHFTHGLPYSLILYPNPGMPTAANAPFPSPGTAIIDTAGKPLQLIAKIFDKNGVWISDYERTSAPINWIKLELTGDSTGKLSDALGYVTVFSPKRAYNTVYITATFDTVGYPKYSDTVLVRIVPGAPKQLVIEADQNWQSSPNAARPVDSIQIAQTETYRYIYAIIRDSLGNFINYSKITDWISLSPDVVTAGDGLTSVGQGVVKRIGAEGSANVAATSREYSGLTDTIKVTVLKYYYTALEIDVRQIVPVTNLTMSTNDDTTLYVRGLRSDTAVWEPVSARWENSLNLIIAPTAPERATSWSFSPVAPAASGWIRVTSGNDALTKPDSVFVVFTRGAITDVTVTILTPPDKRIAGDTITAVVKVFNKDGLIPDTVYCDTTIHQESLGGGNRPDPVVIVDGSASKLNQAPSTATKAHECFNVGLDTIKYVLYYSTTTKDSMQRMYITLNSITASTDPFNLLPAKLSSVAIQDYYGKNLDTVRLASPNGSQVFFVVGFDRYGNKVVLTNGATWTTTDLLHPLEKPFNVVRIYYDAIQVKADEYGHIKAAVMDSAGASIVDSVWLSITGQAALLTSAITRDTNGNGYLDQIELHFERLVSVPNDSTLLRITLPSGDTVPVSAIRSRSGAATDSVFIVYLDELRNNVPQTAWTPVITATRDINGVAPITQFQTSDGAGPVIWNVVKEVKALDDPKQDIVTITFSEPIQSSDGSSFKIGTKPAVVLYVWTKDPSGTYVRDSIVLDGIRTFDAISSDGKTITFTMTNGKDLTARDLISISPNSGFVADKSKLINVPSQNNQKVPVTVISTIPNVIKVGPNPCKPTLLFPPGQDPKTIVLEDEPNAKTWVKTGGTILQFKVAVTSDPNLRVTGYLRIYDVVGNPVNRAENNGNLIKGEWLGVSTVRDINIYWNGVNGQGMKVAPGAYQAFLYLTFQDSKGKQKRVYPGTVGIKR